MNGWRFSRFMTVTSEKPGSAHFHSGCLWSYSSSQQADLKTRGGSHSSDPLSAQWQTQCSGTAALRICFYFNPHALRPMQSMWTQCCSWRTGTAPVLAVGSFEKWKVVCEISIIAEREAACEEEAFWRTSIVFQYFPYFSERHLDICLEESV